MEHILKNTKTYSHDNGLGKPHSYKYVYKTNRNVYESVNGIVKRYMKNKVAFIGIAKSKKEFAQIVRDAQDGVIKSDRIEVGLYNKKDHGKL